MTTEEGLESERHSFLRFVIVSTLTVLGMALCILSPWIFIVVLINLGLQGEPLNYIAFFIVIVILAVAIDWINKRNKIEQGF
jgi:putative flippase GtrA